MEVEEQTLVQGAQGGDQGAFEALFERYRGQLGAVIEARLGPSLQKKLGAEDVIQETFLRGLGAVKEFVWQGEGSLFRWLCGIAVNVIRKAAAHERREPGGVLNDQNGADGTTPSKVFRRDERFDRLQAALDALSPDYRQVILLARIKGLPIAEVARSNVRGKNSKTSEVTGRLWTIEYPRSPMATDPR